MLRAGEGVSLKGGEIHYTMDGVEDLFTGGGAQAT